MPARKRTPKPKSAPPTRAQLYAPTTERFAHRDVCGRCGADVLAGLDDKVLAQHATVDPVPVTAAQELLALAQGLRTYRHLWNGYHRELWRRDRWQITGTPADPSNEVAPIEVHTQHQCQPHWPASTPARRAARIIATHTHAFPLEHHPRSPA